MQLRSLVFLGAAWLIPHAGSADADPVTSPESLVQVAPAKWDWAAPVAQSAALTEMKLYLLNDGDVIIARVLQSRKKTTEVKLDTFFAPRRVDVARTDIGQKHVAFRDGSSRQIVAESGLSAKLPDGSQVTTISNTYRRCYRGPVREVLTRMDAGRHFIVRKALFVLLDRPARFSGGGGQKWFDEEQGSCPNEPPLDLAYRVVTPGGVFLGLPDGSVLMALVEHGLVLRFNGDLDTSSALLNRKVFLFPYDEGDDPLFVGRLTKKDYGSIEDGTARYQEALDDLYNYLSTIKRER